MSTELHGQGSRGGARVLAAPETDISQKGRAGSGQFQAPDLLAGLSMAAGYGAAPLMTPVGTAAGVFDRLKVELGNSYQLGVEFLPEDADGKSHDIRVDVHRPGLDVRSRREMVAPVKPPTVIQRLGAMMAQPVDTPDLPIAIAEYAVRGDAPESLKVIIVAEIARGIRANPPLQYAAAFLDTQRRPVFETNGYAETVPNATTARAILAAQIAPGRYRVRLAAVATVRGAAAPSSCPSRSDYAAPPGSSSATSSSARPTRSVQPSCTSAEIA